MMFLGGTEDVGLPKIVKPAKMKKRILRKERFKVTVSTIENDAYLKNIFKEALVEVLEERQDLFVAIVMEALEEQGLIRAIQEGEKTPTVSREEIFRVLEGEQA